MKYFIIKSVVYALFFFGGMVWQSYVTRKIEKRKRKAAADLATIVMEEFFKQFEKQFEYPDHKRTDGMVKSPFFRKGM